MFGASDSMHALILAIHSQDGDVLVRTSHWRRWRGTEKWAIGHQKDGITRFFDVKTGARLTELSRFERADDPDRWPDYVCAASCTAEA